MSFKSPLRGFPAVRASREAAIGTADAFVGAYDAIPNLVHIYEPGRRTLTAYTGNLVRLRRDSDNAESDFGYDADGNLDTTAITAWLAGANGYVVTVYDQVGGDDVTQAAQVNQPAFGAVVQNGHAGMQFGGNDYLQGAFSGALSQPFNIYTVEQLGAGLQDDGQYYYLLDSDDVTNRLILRKDAGTTPDKFDIHAGVTLVGNAANTNWNIWTALFNGASSQFWLNGVSQATGNAGAHNADGITVGAQYDGARQWNGYITAVIIADPSHSSIQRGAMEAAINGYWGVF